MSDAIRALYEAARYARANGDDEKADRWFTIADEALREDAGMEE